jgi:hypothetical protein
LIRMLTDSAALRTTAQQDFSCAQVVCNQEAKYIESWPNTTSAWACWSRFDIPVDMYDGVHSLLLCTRITLGSSTCH